MKNLLLCFFLLPVFVGAQNLVPNPSFEDYSLCPDDYSQISNCIGWISFGETPDYYNSCSISQLVSVPLNGVGYQNAFDGLAYAGIYTYISPNIREYLGRQLSYATIIGVKYYLSLKVSCADFSTCSTNNIGVFLSSIYLDSSSNSLLTNNSLIHTPNIISDTSNWTLIKGSFIADSAYDYIYLGNFYSDSLTDTSHNGNFFGVSFSYYFIDDICLSTDSLECDFNPEDAYNLSDINIATYPNPASEEIFISFNNSYNEISIINMLGEVIKTYSSNETSSIDISNISSGFYILQIRNQNKIIQKKQIILH